MPRSAKCVSPKPATLLQVLRFTDMKIALARLLAAALILPHAVLAQITVTGVADKSTYNNTVTFTVATQAGYDYNATLNWQPIATGVPVTVSPDFYELRVDATNQATSAVSSLYRRFIVVATERGGSEWGLPPHVPFPVIQSSPSEFVGARLRMLAPSSFPAGYEIPVVAWVVDEDNHAVRANGLLAATNQNSIQVKRGVGSGFLASNQPPGILNYTPSVGGLATNKSIELEPSTAWTDVSGVINGSTTWPAQSRIRVTAHMAVPAGSSLTIGAGTVVLLNPGVNITNNGAVIINGSVEQPVIFMPHSRSQPWGGFFMRTSSGSLNASGTIFIASGADPNGGAGHRSEQCLFLVDNSPTLTLTDSAAIHLAGQLGHAYNGGTFTFTRFLMQRATTGGEYTRSQFTVNDSAFIECPDDTANYIDGDNDGLYIIGGLHAFTNTLFGWTKDDGIDSGGTDSSGSFARISYESCWFESIFHEGNSLSGYKNISYRNSVYLDCGQGIEDGYNAPTGRVDNCFFTMCQSGIRHGDNYPSIGNYDGRLTATNNISIYNHRDLFGFNWNSSGGWTNSHDRFFASNNLVSVLDSNYPNNSLWNPVTDGWRLAQLGGVGHPGIGFGIRSGQSSLSQFPEGIPVGLSRFSTNEVTVNYEIDGTDGTHAAGTLVFPAGLTRRFIPAPTNVNGVLRIALLNPANADVTGPPALLFQNLPPLTNVPAAVVLSPLGASWKYLDDGSEQGTEWRSTNFNDGAWTAGPARLGFGSDPAPLATTLRRYVQLSGTNTSRQVTNFYFRRTIVVTNPAEFATLQFRHQRDDGCIVYLNGREMFRNNMAPGPVTANTFASGTAGSSADALQFRTNVLSATNLIIGTNIIAAEVHQATATSSDIGWEMELQGSPESGAPRVHIVLLGADAVLYWNGPGYILEEADIVTGPWQPAADSSPSASPATGTRFFRLRK